MTSDYPVRSVSFAEVTAGKSTAKHVCVPWCDSDVYKVLEGASYVLGYGGGDADLKSQIEQVTAMVADAQLEDGYLYTPRSADPEDMHEFCGKERWSHPFSHELFNSGHLF